MAEETIQIKSAGEVQIDEITLIVNTAVGGKAITTEVDLRAIFAELNLFEDIFSNSLYGNILISDSNNLLDQLSIQGLEGLRIDVRTPGLSDKQRIRKTFGVYSIADQQIISNDRMQTYRLHFCSLELLNDALTKPLNRPIPASDDSVEPTASKLIPFLYKTYVLRQGANQVPRNLVVKDGKVQKDGASDLILGAAQYEYTEAEKVSENVYADEGADTTNKIKFIATNWTPLKSINWIANRAVPTNKSRGGTFLFFESNKAFHFTSIDDLIQGGKRNAGKFVFEYSPANINDDTESSSYSIDPAAGMRRVLKMEVGHTFNVLAQQQNGYFGQELRSIDPILKRYREHQYSFEQKYTDFEHTTYKDDIGMFPNAPSYMLGKEKTSIDPRHHVTVRHRQPYFLYENEQTPLANHAQWLSQRVARIASLGVFTLNLLVYGRSDIKVGDTCYFDYPNARAKKPTDDPSDYYFTGTFLITAIRHFISPLTHQMTLEIMKDGLEQKPDSGETEPLELHIDP